MPRKLLRERCSIMDLSFVESVILLTFRFPGWIDQSMPETIRRTQAISMLSSARPMPNPVKAGRGQHVGTSQTNYRLIVLSPVILWTHCREMVLRSAVHVGEQCVSAKTRIRNFHVTIVRYALGRAPRSADTAPQKQTSRAAVSYSGKHPRMAAIGGSGRGTTGRSEYLGESPAGFAPRQNRPAPLPCGGARSQQLNA